jgi:hypothetical protein
MFWRSYDPNAAALACLFCLAIVPAAAQETGDAEQARDEVHIEWRTNDNGIRGVRASFLVRSTRESLWSLLTDYALFPKIFRNVLKATVLKESVDGAEVGFVVNAKIRDLHYVLDRRYADRGHRISWRKISGDLGAIEGVWTIDDGPKPGLLKVTYESYVEVGWYVPELAVRLSASNEVREMARALRERLARAPGA